MTRILLIKIYLILGAALIAGFIHNTQVSRNPHHPNIIKMKDSLAARYQVIDSDLTHKISHKVSYRKPQQQIDRKALRWVIESIQNQLMIMGDHTADIPSRLLTALWLTYHGKSLYAPMYRRIWFTYFYFGAI